ANTTLTAAHYEVLCANDDGDGDITVDVADDPSTCPGRRYRVHKIHTDATTVEVQDDGGNPLETLYVAGDWVEIASDGTAWRVLGGYLTPIAPAPILPSICDGRLTLTSGVPVPTSDVIA